MPLIIDTYNVLHTVGVLPPDLAGIDVQGLIGLLKRSRYRDDKVTLACDGKPQPDLASPDPNIAIRFSGAGKPADDLIGQLVRASTAPRRLIVVSTDHAVQRTAQRRRCKVLTSEEFLTQLAEDANVTLSSPPCKASAKAPGQLSESQVERWIKLFELDETKIEQLRKTQIESPAKKATKAPEPPPEPAPLDLDDRDEVKPVIPPSLIEQAEQLLQEHDASESKGKPPSE